MKGVTDADRQIQVTTRQVNWELLKKHGLSKQCKIYFSVTTDDILHADVVARRALSSRPSGVRSSAADDYGGCPS